MSIPNVWSLRNLKDSRLSMLKIVLNLVFSDRAVDHSHFLMEWAKFVITVLLVESLLNKYKVRIYT